VTSAHTARYKKTPKGKAANKRYRQSAKGKATATRYRQTAKAKAREGQYRRSEKGKAALVKARARHKAKLRALPNLNPRRPADRASAAGLDDPARPEDLPLSQVSSSGLR
jgi:hypothetical protein